MTLLFGHSADRVRGQQQQVSASVAMMKHHFDSQTVKQSSVGEASRSATWAEESDLLKSWILDLGSWFHTPGVSWSNIKREGASVRFLLMFSFFSFFLQDWMFLLALQWNSTRIQWEWPHHCLSQESAEDEAASSSQKRPVHLRFRRSF